MTQETIAPFTCKRCGCQWKGDPSKCQQCGTTLWDVDREDLVAFEREPRFGRADHFKSSGTGLERAQVERKRDGDLPSECKRCGSPRDSESKELCPVCGNPYRDEGSSVEFRQQWAWDSANVQSMRRHIEDLEADNAKLRRRVELLLDLVINQQGVK